MGNEIKRDTCPAKYCAKGSAFKDTIPSIFALVIVTYMSGSLFEESGMNIALTIVIEVIFAVILYSTTYFMFRGMKKRLAETYISVCENGVCGICPANGFKNKEFSLAFDEITKMTVKGERLFLYAKKGAVVLTLNDAAGIASLIKSKNSNL